MLPTLEGSFGELPSEYATPLALALTELVTNSVEHGLAGRTDGAVVITAARTDERLTVRVRDNGEGLPEGKVGSGLGTQIVRTLIQGELSGSIDWHTLTGSGDRGDDRGAAHVAAAASRLVDLDTAPFGAYSIFDFRLNPASRASTFSQEARRARAARRLSARRSSSERPPQTPESCEVSSAYCRHISVTGQVAQTALAFSICSTAGRCCRSGRTARGLR